MRRVILVLPLVFAATTGLGWALTGAGWLPGLTGPGHQPAPDRPHDGPAALLADRTRSVSERIRLLHAHWTAGLGASQMSALRTLLIDRSVETPVRNEAMNLLLRERDPALAETLGQVLAGPGDPVFRAFAGQGLADLALDGRAAPGARAQAVALLTPLVVGDDDDPVAAHGLRALVPLGDAGALARQRRELDREAPGPATMAAIRLVRPGDADLIGALHRWAESGPVSERAAALERLVALGDPRAAELCRLAEADADAVVTTAGRIGLARLGENAGPP